jgi:hypothetical protein
MADPIGVPCPKNTWVKVVNSLAICTVYFNRVDNVIYFFTYRVAGNPAPTTDNDDGKALEVNFQTIPAHDYAPNNHGLSFNSPSGTLSDIYVRAVGSSGTVTIHS